MKNYFGYWSKKEIAYLIVFSMVIAWVSLSFIDPTKPDWFNYLNIISAVSGMICVVLVAKRSILNFPIGIINVITYGYISYVYHWNGSMILNWAIFFPFQFIGWWLWKPQLNHETTEVNSKRLTSKQWLLTILTIVIGITIDMEFLRQSPAYVSFINVQNVPLLDSISTNLSILATILMTYRYAEQWILWIVIDIVTIAMWLYSFMIDGNGALPLLIMWSAWLINAIYGYHRWRVNWVNFTM
jgi:nicotinamide mononucleotide transporter